MGTIELVTLGGGLLAVVTTTLLWLRAKAEIKELDAENEFLTSSLESLSEETAHLRQQVHNLTQNIDYQPEDDLDKGKF